MDTAWKRKNTGTGLMPYFVAGVIAVSLKCLYSRASSDDLTWILAPTAHLVSWLTGLSFIMDSPAGYVNRDYGITIAPSCSGVNFLIIAFAMAFFSFARRLPTDGSKYLWIGAALTCSYALTLGVNTLRICVSIATISHDIHAGWLTSERIHRIEGIVIYFFFLCLFYHGLHKSTAVDNRIGKPKTGPLFWYLTMALFVPVMTGNFRNTEHAFIEHGLTVILVCSFVLGLMFGLRKLCRLLPCRDTGFQVPPRGRAVP